MTSSEITPERGFLACLETLIGFPLQIKEDEEVKEVLEISNTKGFDLHKLEKDFYVS
jgi:hypothetical protein